MSATPEQIADERADWLLDAIAGATQDRQFLRGDAECSPVICEAVLLNGAKAIRTAIARAHEARMSAASDSIAEPHSFSPDEIAHRIEHFGATFDLDVMKQAAALIRAQAERVRVLEGALNLIAQWDISGPPLTKNDANIPPEDFPHYVAGRAHAELALIRNYARNSVARAAPRGEA